MTTPKTRLVQVETHAGIPIKHGRITITPFARSLRIGSTGKHGGLIWNRPASILIQSADGEEQIMPIPDITRQILWTLLGVSVLIALLAWIFNRNKP